MGSMVRFDSESPQLFGGDKLFVEWLPDGEILVADGDSWDPDLSYALAWWQREACWYDDASAEYEMAYINHCIDDRNCRRTVDRYLQAVALAQSSFYELLEARTGWLPAHANSHRNTRAQFALLERLSSGRDGVSVE